MTYHTIQPPQVLTDFVRCFWVLESDQPYTHRSMADISPELVFHYKGQFDEIRAGGMPEKSFISGIHGQSLTYRRFHIDESFGIFGVYLYPHAVPLLFGIPSSELTNQIPDLASVLGREGVALEEKMITAPDNMERVRIISAYLKQKLVSNHQNPPPVFASMNYIIRNRGLVKVKQVADEHFLSERQFERTFKQFSGFSPKLFSRIVRFQEAMNKFGENHQSLTAIACECGYYDQSHFIHEFKEFSGYHPGHYFSGKAEGTAWRN